MHSRLSVCVIIGLFSAAFAADAAPKVQVSINEHGKLTQEKENVNATIQSSLVRKEEKAKQPLQSAAKETEVQDPDEEDADTGVADDELLQQDDEALDSGDAVKSNGDDDDDTDSEEDSSDSDDTPSDENDDAGDDDSQGDSLVQNEEVDRSAWGRRRRSRRRRARRRRAPKPVNCKWGPWKEGKCDKTCGVGEKTSIRSKKVVEKRGGTCDGKDEKTEVCNAGDCPPPPTPAPTPAPTMPVQAFASRKASFSLLSIVASYIAVRAAVF